MRKQSYLREGGVLPIDLVLALVIRVRRAGHDEARSGDLHSDSEGDTRNKMQNARTSKHEFRTNRCHTDDNGNAMLQSFLSKLFKKAIG